ncbi:GMC oxidoreductase [Microlunatus ginsengisoli]|uniref:GMC family oxidoreductase n=1 Tax=Microlunatus ginsengisoli TaxID=363863 RepID=A0ABP6ZXP3_9ACTN
MTGPGRAILAALLDVLVPADSEPSAVGAGVLDRLDALIADQLAEAWRELLEPGLRSLAAEPGPPSERLVAELEQQSVRPGWTVSPAAFVEAMNRIAQLGYYGAPDSPSWPAVGFDPAGKRPPSAPVVFVEPRSVSLGEVADSYDVVIVGAGAGGGVAAQVISAAGARVLLLDRGRFLSYAEIGTDHLANQRLSAYGHNAGPEADGNPRLMREAGGDRLIAKSYAPGWQNNAMTVGGGTRVYQGMAWRLQPEDFALATRWGVPAASSLADWPLTYADLEPFYTRAEWELGVCGDGSAHRRQGFRSREYPMPPLPPTLEAEVLGRGARELGLTTGPVPLLINSVPRDGRADCVRCGTCVGFACPVDAKNGAHNTTIARALATGSCTLATGAYVRRVLVDRHGSAAGVEVQDLDTGLRRTVRAASVVLSAGAIETARLLLASATDRWPAGLGNDTDQVGRHLQGHIYTGAYGIFDEIVQDMQGPGVSIATADWIDDLGGEGIGGGVLANEVIKIPALFWSWALGPDAPRWGRAGKQRVRDVYLRTSHVFGPIQEIPSPECRVRLSDSVRDAWGQPAVLLSGAVHPESVRAAEALRRRAETWMRAGGAREVWVTPIGTGLSGGQHQAGTARMGTDPATSVTDPFGRVHGHPGLWVCDASLHVTNGGVNPVLTVLALAFRVAEEIVRSG